jgi:hypothetical protein
MNETVLLDQRRGPDRVWEPTGTGPNGERLWGSREWEPGERAEYEHEVLRKRPQG